MKILVRYFSKLGHTKDIAMAMGEELGVEGKSITEESELLEEADILFLGGAPYANVMDDKLRRYANNLTPDKARLVVLFTTSNWSRRTVRALRKILRGKGIAVHEDYFYAHMLNIPNRIPEARKFARRVVGEIEGSEK